MSTKPVIIPTWATSGAITTPSAGKVIVGFVPGERGAAQYFNYLQNANGLWLTYLNALLTTGGGATDNIDTSGNANFGGTLGAGGTVTFGGILNVTGLVTGTAGFTAAVNQHVTVSGVGRHKHGLMTLQVHGSLFQPLSSGTLTYGLSTGGVNGVQMNAASSAGAPITLPAGCRILAIRVYMQDNATGPTTWAAHFASISSTGTRTNIATSSTSAGTGANQALPMTGLTTTLAALTSYWITLENVVGAQLGLVYMAEVDYDMP